MTHALSAASLFGALKGWNALEGLDRTGIGLMIAQTLVANGARVFVTGRRTEALNKSVDVHGKVGAGEMIPLKVDVTEKESLLEAAKEVRSKAGYLNLLVNNAGILPPRVQLPDPKYGALAWSDAMLEQDIGKWDDGFRTNVTACYLATAVFLPLLADAVTKGGASEPGSVVNISSISGIMRTSQNGQFAYNSSKAATIQLTRLLALELRRFSQPIRVNSIAPGYFPSEMTVGQPDEANKSHMESTGFRDQKGVPAGRPGNETDMGQALLSVACNKYINGQTIVVDGGWLLEHP